MADEYKVQVSATLDTSGVMSAFQKAKDDIQKNAIHIRLTATDKELQQVADRVQKYDGDFSKEIDLQVNPGTLEKQSKLMVEWGKKDGDKAGATFATAFRQAIREHMSIEDMNKVIPENNKKLKEYLSSFYKGDLLTMIRDSTGDPKARTSKSSVTGLAKELMTAQNGQNMLSGDFDFGGMSYVEIVKSAEALETLRTVLMAVKNEGKDFVLFGPDGIDLKGIKSIDGLLNGINKTYETKLLPIFQDTSNVKKFQAEIQAITDNITQMFSDFASNLTNIINGSMKIGGRGGGGFGENFIEELRKFDSELAAQYEDILAKIKEYEGKIEEVGKHNIDFAPRLNLSEYKKGVDADVNALLKVYGDAAEAALKQKKKLENDIAQINNSDKLNKAQKDTAISGVKDQIRELYNYLASFEKTLTSSFGVKIMDPAIQAGRKALAEFSNYTSSYHQELLTALDPKFFGDEAKKALGAMAEEGEGIDDLTAKLEELKKQKDSIEKDAEKKMGNGKGGGSTSVNGEFDADEMLANLQKELEDKPPVVVNAKFDADKMIEALQEELKSKDPVEVNAKFDASAMSDGLDNDFENNQMSGPTVPGYFNADQLIDSLQADLKDGKHDVEISAKFDTKSKTTDESGEVKDDNNQVPISIVEDAQNTVDALITKVNEKLAEIDKDQTISFTLERTQQFKEELETLKKDIELVNGDNSVNVKVTGITKSLVDNLSSAAKSIMYMYEFNGVTIEWNQEKYQEFLEKLTEIKNLLDEVKKGATGKDGIPVGVVPETSQLKPTLDSAFKEINKTPFGVEVDVATDVREKIRDRIGTEAFNVAVRPTAPPKRQVEHTETITKERSDGAQVTQQTSTTSGTSQGNSPISDNVGKTFDQASESGTRFNSTLKTIVSGLRTVGKEAEKATKQAAKFGKNMSMEEPEEKIDSLGQHINAISNTINKENFMKAPLLKQLEEAFNELVPLLTDTGKLFSEQGQIAGYNYFMAFKQAVIGKPGKLGGYTQKPLAESTLKRFTIPDTDGFKEGELYTKKGGVLEPSSELKGNINDSYKYLRELKNLLEEVRTQFSNIDSAMFTPETWQKILNLMDDYATKLSELRLGEAIPQDAIKIHDELFKIIGQVAKFDINPVTNAIEAVKEEFDELSKIKDPFVTISQKAAALKAIEEVRKKLSEFKDQFKTLDDDTFNNANNMLDSMVTMINGAKAVKSISAPPTTPPPSGPVDNGEEDVNPVIPVEIVFSNVQEAYDKLKDEITKSGPVDVGVNLPVRKAYVDLQRTVRENNPIDINATLNATESYNDLLTQVPRYTPVNISSVYQPTADAYANVTTDIQNHGPIPVNVSLRDVTDTQSIQGVVTQISNAFGEVRQAADSASDQIAYLIQGRRVALNHIRDAVGEVTQAFNDFVTDTNANTSPERLVNLRFDVATALTNLQTQLDAATAPHIDIQTGIDATSFTEATQSITTLIQTLEGFRAMPNFTEQFRRSGEQVEQLRERFNALAEDFRRTGDTNAFANALSGIDKSTLQAMSGLAEVGIADRGWVRNASKEDLVNRMVNQVTGNLINGNTLNRILEIVGTDIPNAIREIPAAFSGIQDDVHIAVDGVIGEVRRIAESIEESVGDSFDGLSNISALFDSLTRLMSNVRFEDVATNLSTVVGSMREFLTLPMNENNIFSTIENILGQTDQLQTFAEVMRSTRQEVDRVAEAVQARRNARPEIDATMRENTIEAEIDRIRAANQGLRDELISIQRMYNDQQQLTSAIVTVKNGPTTQRMRIGYEQFENEDGDIDGRPITRTASNTEYLKAQKEFLKQYEQNIRKYEALQRIVDNAADHNMTIDENMFRQYRQLRAIITENQRQFARMRENVMQEADRIGDEPLFRETNNQFEYITNAFNGRQSIHHQRRTRLEHEEITAEYDRQEGQDEASLRAIADEYRDIEDAAERARVAQHDAELDAQLMEEHNRYLAERAQRYQDLTELVHMYEEAQHYLMSHDEADNPDMFAAYRDGVQQIPGWIASLESEIRNSPFFDQDMHNQALAPLEGLRTTMDQYFTGSVNTYRDAVARYEELQARFADEFRDSNFSDAIRDQLNAASQAVREARQVVMRNLDQFNDGLANQFHRIDDTFVAHMRARENDRPQAIVDAENEAINRLSDENVEDRRNGLRNQDRLINEQYQRTAEEENNRILANLGQQREAYQALGEAVNEYRNSVETLGDRAWNSTFWENTIFGLIGQIREAGVASIEGQRMLDNALDSVMEIRSRAAEVSDDRLGDGQTQRYNELRELVREYTVLSKDVAARRLPFEGWGERVAALNEQIQRTVEYLRQSRFYSQELEENALRGLEALPRDLAKIQFSQDKNDAKQYEQQLNTMIKSLKEYTNALLALKEVQDDIDYGKLDDTKTSVQNKLRNARNKVAKADAAINPTMLAFMRDDIQTRDTEALARYESVRATYEQPYVVEGHAIDDVAAMYKKLINNAQTYWELVTKRSTGKTLTYNESIQLRALDGLYHTVINDAANLEAQLSGDDVNLPARLQEAMTNAKNRPVTELYNDIGKTIDKYADTPGNDKYNEWISNIKAEYQGLANDIMAIDWTGAGEEQIAEMTERLNNFFNAIKANRNNKEFKSVSDSDVAALNRQMSEWMAKNTAAPAQAIQQVKEYQRQLASVTDEGALKKIKAGFEEVKRSTLDAGQAGLSFADKLKGTLGNLTRYLMSFASFYRIFGTLKQGVEVIKEQDKALTEMRKVSDESVRSLQNYQKASFDLANQVGTTATQVQQSTADWMRLGKTMEEASKSAQLSTMLLNVSEFSNIDEATDALVAMSQAFKEVEIQDTIDKLNSVGL